MRFNIESIIAASALVSSAAAQTWTVCNPMEKKCPNDPALAGEHKWDFSKGESKEFKCTGSSNRVTYDSEGMHMAVKSPKDPKFPDAPTLTSNFYIFWGSIEVVMKAAEGAGVISSLVFQSDNLDEIDFEWVGSDVDRAQSNYFGKGDTSSYDRGAFHPCAGSTSGFHTYKIDWTKEKMAWYIDGKVVREVLPSQVNGTWTRYPQTPMQIKIGAWDAGFKGQKEGTLQWAGGNTDYSKPHTMVVKSIHVIDYSKGAKEYEFGDKSGKWESIKLNKAVSKKVKDTEDEDSSSNSTATSTTMDIQPTSNATATSDDSSESTDSSSSSDSIESADSSNSTTSSTGSVPTAEGANSGVGAIKALGSAFVTSIVALVVFAL